MTPQEVRDLLEATGAVRRGHFQLSSGLHSPTYVQCALLLQHPAHAARVAEALARRLGESAVDVVAAPALGGIVLGYELARQLDARAIFAERNSEGRLSLRRGFALRPGERVLVAEDVVTTGGSTRETIEVVRQAGGQVVGVAALIDRSSGGVQLGVRLEALLTENIEAYPPDACPLCRDRLPLEKPGSRPALSTAGPAPPTTKPAPRSA
ncbi:MAG: orotate phosphoribosyltransferase [Acidobacteria bacterium]|nr:orotate phosphoribosyltransferase [Acidobacteriota bacterium]